MVLVCSTPCLPAGWGEIYNVNLLNFSKSFFLSKKISKCLSRSEVSSIVPPSPRVARCEETGSIENWEAHCAGPGTNSEHPVSSGDQPPHSLSATRNETISLAQITSSNLEALRARAIALENYTKALDTTLHGGRQDFPICRRIICNL